MVTVIDRTTIVNAARLLIAWGTVVAFLVFGGAWLDESASGLRSALLFAWLLGTISWCAFGVVDRAELLGAPWESPLGTLTLMVINLSLGAALSTTPGSPSFSASIWQA